MTNPNMIGNHTLLDSVTGSVKPGQLMAIMGASGAGKTTFLDILFIDVDFKKVAGYVDQEDTLMSTLTVYETVLYSALLWLLREMSLEAKKFRTLETTHELGLDSYNALSVIDSLVSLARDYNRTVVFTIHQPRSNIVSLFDQLIVLAQGKLIYSGGAGKCQEYLQSIGHPCPPGFNIADFFIDLTMQASIEPSSTESPPAEPVPSDGDNNLRDDVFRLPDIPLTVILPTPPGRAKCWWQCWQDQLEGECVLQVADVTPWDFQVQ
ncbi:P-loop containing nucleoside triphosphate hydrolase protein [Sparassis latifolia]